jgi:hypothetical protein
MHERVLAEEKLREDDIGMIHELGEDSEDQMTLAMRPP